MDEKQFSNFLADCVVENSAEMDIDLESFQEAGVLTNNEGLVIRTPDGSEFQVTIVKSI